MSEKMGLAETRELFKELVVDLVTNLPNLDKSQATGSNLNDQLNELVPMEKRQKALDCAMALSDDDAFFCLNRLHEAVDLPGDKNEIRNDIMQFFASSFWQPLSHKAYVSAAYEAKQKKNSQK